MHAVTDPREILDTANLDILAGPKGLKPGDELTVSDQLRPVHSVRTDNART